MEISEIKKTSRRPHDEPDAPAPASDSLPILDEEIVYILEQLAEGLFPLAEWIDDKISRGGYLPPGDLPWRAPGQPLTPAKLGIVAFFEELLRESGRDRPLAMRWRRLVSSDPVGGSPISDLDEWRRCRPGLQPATFGIAASDNILLDADNRPTWRAEFYQPYWPLLKTTIRAADPQTPRHWQVLAAELFIGAAEHWPVAEPNSAIFIQRLARDLLYAMLSMRNPASDEWRHALLIELGEHRRVGNSFTRTDAEGFVTTFTTKLTGSNDGN